MAKVIGNYRTDLRLDLKDGGAVWSDAELDRCVERAVADLTRFRPLEKSAEFIVDATVSAESFTTPAASDPDYFVDNKDISTVTDGGTCTLAARTPDVPRPVLVTVTDAAASITDFVIIVKGRDVDGNYIEEFFYLAGGLVQTGVKYFATVTEVELDTFVGEGANDKLDVGTGSHFGVFVQLDNKPIKFNSDAISGFTRYTHYTMDYYNGCIAMKDAATGDMVADTAYNIAYTKSKVTVDLSNLSDLIRVERVEYPVGTTPQDMSTLAVWGSILTLTSSGLESQAEASDEQHILVHYLARHQPPGASSPGTYPSFLDWTVELAASAYALFIEALQYEQQAATDLLEVKTTLGYLGIGGVGAAALTLVYKAIDDALDQVATYLVAAVGTDPDNAEDRLAAISDMETKLRDMVTKLADGTGAIADANAYLAEVDTSDLGNATDGAEKMISTGHPKIDTLTDGSNVGALYADYARANAQVAQARTQAALGFLQEANTRLSLLRSYIEEAGAWVHIGETFIAEAQSRIAEANVYLAESAQYQETIANDLLLADRFRAEAIERRNEAWAIWASPPQYAPLYTLGQTRQPL